MKNIKVILIYILIILFLAFTCISGCVKKEDNIKNDVSQEEDLQEDDIIEVEQDPDTDQDEEISDSEETVQEESTENQEEEQQEPPTSVELSAKHVGGHDGNITMIFDLVGGEVSGNLELEYAEVFLDGTSTVICQYYIVGDITGTIDLETRIITAEFNGEASSDDKGCYEGELKFNLIGKISKDYSVAGGTTDYGGVDWSVYD
jgi:hypothetical protein